jgi:hypothetical protein
MDAKRRAEVFPIWSQAMRDLARHPNVFCKIGGLGTAYWGFGFNERPEADRLSRACVGLEAVRRDRDRSVRRRSLHEGERLSCRRSLVRVRSVVERIEVHREQLFHGGKGRTIAPNSREGISHRVASRPELILARRGDEGDTCNGSFGLPAWAIGASQGARPGEPCALRRESPRYRAGQLRPGVAP